MSKPPPGPRSTQAARAGSAMNARALVDITIRTVAAVLWASEAGAPARACAHWWAPAASQDPLGGAGVGAARPRAATMARRS